MNTSAEKDNNSHRHYCMQITVFSASICVFCWSCTSMKSIIDLIFWLEDTIYFWHRWSVWLLRLPQLENIVCEKCESRPLGNCMQKNYNNRPPNEWCNRMKCAQGSLSNQKPRTEARWRLLHSGIGMGNHMNMEIPDEILFHFCCFCFFFFIYRIY